MTNEKHTLDIKAAMTAGSNKAYLSSMSNVEFHLVDTSIMSFLGPVGLCIPNKTSFSFRIADAFGLLWKCPTIRLILPGSLSI